jgi:Family of unknown function (DUF6300)
MDVEVRDEVLTCQGCGSEPYLQASFPADNGSTAELVVAVCPVCDVDSRTAGPVIAWFVVNDRVEEANVEEFAEVLMRWLQDASPPDIDPAVLRQTVIAWAEALG